MQRFFFIFCQPSEEPYKAKDSPIPTLKRGKKLATIGGMNIEFVLLPKHPNKTPKTIEFPMKIGAITKIIISQL